MKIFQFWLIYIQQFPLLGNSPAALFPSAYHLSVGNPLEVYSSTGRM